MQNLFKYVQYFSTTLLENLSSSLVKSNVVVCELKNVKALEISYRRDDVTVPLFLFEDAFYINRIKNILT